MVIDFDGNDFLIGVGILCVLLPVIWWRKHSLSYLLFFSLIGAYLLAVVIFPVVIDTERAEIVFTPNINLVPFYFDECFRFVELCVRSVVDNIVLAIPLGFGINFLVRIKSKNIFWLAFAVGFVFELSQLFISIVFRSGFRATDINDVLLNGTGVLIGHTLFRPFAWLYLETTQHFNFKHKLIFADIYEVALQTQVADGSKNT